MKPVYKRVKEMKPHCPNCKERLIGNNSFAFPYECACGIWVLEGGIDFGYKIKKRKK